MEDHLCGKWNLWYCSCLSVALVCPRDKLNPFGRTHLLSVNSREPPSLSLPSWCPSGPSDEPIACHLVWPDTRCEQLCPGCPGGQPASSPMASTKFLGKLHFREPFDSLLGQTCVVYDFNLKCCTSISKESFKMFWLVSPFIPFAVFFQRACPRDSTWDSE